MRAGSPDRHNHGCQRRQSETIQILFHDFHVTPLLTGFDRCALCAVQGRVQRRRRNCQNGGWLRRTAWIERAIEVLRKRFKPAEFCSRSLKGHFKRWKQKSSMSSDHSGLTRFARPLPGTASRFLFPQGIRCSLCSPAKTRADSPQRRTDETGLARYLRGGRQPRPNGFPFTEGTGRERGRAVPDRHRATPGLPVCGRPDRAANEGVAT